MISVFSVRALRAPVNERQTDVLCGGDVQVRVPLNTALLAVQNMQASGMITQDIEFKALEGSLSMMSKGTCASTRSMCFGTDDPSQCSTMSSICEYDSTVIDVFKLNEADCSNRMDSGRFESVLKPYKFHQVLRSLFVPLQLATDARGLQFVIDLDNTIDEVARRALFEAMGEPDEAITRKLHENPDEFGIVVGDETRLRQIITNLARCVVSEVFAAATSDIRSAMHASSRQQEGNLLSLLSLSYPSRLPRRSGMTIWTRNAWTTARTSCLLMVHALLQTAMDKYRMTCHGYLQHTLRSITCCTRNQRRLWSGSSSG